MSEKAQKSALPKARAVSVIPRDRANDSPMASIIQTALRAAAAHLHAFLAAPTVDVPADVAPACDARADAFHWHRHGAGRWRLKTA